MISALAVGLTAGLLVQRGGDEPAAFDFRGARLGMTLSEFRQLAYPDDRPLAQGTRVYCSDDPLPGAQVFQLIRPNPLDRAIGVTKCAYFRRSLVAGHEMWDQMTVLAGDYPGLDHTYDFSTLDGSGEPVLFRTTMRLSCCFHAVRDGLQARFGPPRPDDGSQNPPGFHIVSWERDDQHVSLTDLPHVGLSLSYRLHSVEQAVEGRREQVVGRAIDRF
jgi:hypothetical protein